MSLCTGPWPSHLSKTTCPPPGLTWHTSRLSTFAPWPTITQPWRSAKAPVSVSPTSLCVPTEAPCSRSLASLTPPSNKGGTVKAGAHLPVLNYL